MKRHNARRRACLATSALCLIVAPRLLAQTAAPAPETADETIVLSPFVVEAAEDSGYSAKATLAGTRIRTELKDVGSSISVVTQKFLEDTNSTNMEDLLVYTTGTEVAGQGGNFLGQGDGMVLVSQNVNRPVANTRVRGLAAADNTRDFFLTDIPWDSYNVGRVDLQRGPNAILFGIGSPAGIVNSSLNPAAFKNAYKIENQIGSFGTIRTTADLNHVLIKNQLAIRIALLDDETKFRQDPAYKDDRRVYGAIRFDPAALNRGSAKTSFTANFEKGKQTRLDPINTPPIDAITPWFFAYTPAQRAVGFSAADPANYSPSTDLNDPLVQQYGAYLGNYNGSRPVGLSQSDPWLGAPGGRVFDGVVTAYEGGQPGFVFPTKIQNWPTNASIPGTVLGNNGIVGITQYAAGVGGFSGNAGLVGSSIGAYKAKSLTDRSIFDYYNHLLGGPNAQQFNDFKAFNVTGRQTFFDDKLGFELAFDKQDAKFGNWSLIDNAATAVSIDIMRTLIDGTKNPNFLRPVVYAAGGGSGGSWDRSEREVVRATAFGELDFATISGRDSVLAKIFGRNTFTGLFARQKTYDFRANYNRFYIADSFVPAAGNGAVGQASRDNIFAVYLGSPIPANAASASGVGLQGIKTFIDAPSQQTIRYYNNQTNAWQTLPLDTVNNDLAADEQKTYRTSRKTKDIVTSKAVVWQGYWLEGALVPMFGWREDEDVFRDAGNPPAVPANPQGQGGLVNPFSPNWTLPEASSAENTVRSKTYSLVTHLPAKWRERMPGRMDVSLIYNKSENFNPDSSRRDIMGASVPNPAGKTEEYGVAITALDDRLVFKWAHYETSVTNATLDSAGISAQYLIGAVEAWGQKSAVQFRDSLAPGGPRVGNASTLYGLSSDGHQVTWQPDGVLASQNPDGSYQYTQAQLDATYAREKASVDAWFATQVPAAFQDAWALTDYATGGGSTNYGASGLVVTGDTISKGDEFELIANPIKGLSVSVNAAKTSASRMNLAQSYVDWINQRWEEFQGPAGDMRLWGPADDSQSPNGRQFGHGGETARGKYSRETMAGYNLFLALEGADVPELRPWRFNVVANYDFQGGISWLKGVNVGGSYRWQQRNTTGFPVVGAGTATDPYRYDVSNPYKGSDEGIFDGWVGYRRHLGWKNVAWRVQLNVRNLLANDHLSRVTVQPNGEPGAYRIPEPRTITLTNTFEF